MSKNWFKLPSSFYTNHSNAVPLLEFFFVLCIRGFICGVYFVIICSSSLLLVPREDCAS